jgi:2-polyprenyl-3-methyl-5-hydroxy-6-metoxy-1,4-benzoquinol methylase
MYTAASIRMHRQPQCHVCGGTGDVIYTDLRDRLFGVPGEWTLRQCRAAECGLLWLDPMPVEEDLPRLYKTYYTHPSSRNPTYAEVLRDAMKCAYWRAAYGPKSSRVLPALMTLAPGFRAQLAIQVFDLQCVEGGRLLDVGCGSGAALQRLAELGWRCEGIDFDERAVEAGRARGLDVRVGSLEEQGYPAATFDAVVMNHVLEHVPDPRALLSESMRILKPGGQFACITPNAESWCHSMFGRDWRELDPPRHLHIFTRSSVGMLMQEMTWKSIEVQSSIANTHVIAWSSWQLKRSGQLDMRARPGLWGSAWGRLLQVAASLRHLADTETGEEILVHAVKLK